MPEYLGTSSIGKVGICPLIKTYGSCIWLRPGIAKAMEEHTTLLLLALQAIKIT
jgi:hypothetical protein